MAVRVFSNCRIFSTLVYIHYLHAMFAMLNFSSITAWNLGCGFSQNVNQLIAFRFLAGIGGSAPLAVRIPHDQVLDLFF